MSAITNASNPAIKAIRRLRQRRERERSGTFFVEGIRLVAEAARTGASVEQCVVAPELLASAFARGVVRELRERSVPVLEVSREVFGSLSGRENPQGIGAVVRQDLDGLAELPVSPTLGFVALDGVADPGNLGTILRTCDGAGFDGVILLGETTDPYDLTALRASMGAVFTRRIARAGWPELLEWRAARGYQLVGAASGARTSYRGAAYVPPLVLLVGSERAGLSAEQKAVCDLTVSIPMAGAADSLNLAVAAGILMYEIATSDER